MVRTLYGAVALFSLSFLLQACSGVYYDAMERFGIEKREILVDRVQSARGAQENAQEEFRSALDAFRATVDVDGGDLEKKYDRLSGAYEDAENSAEAVRERIDSVDDVGRALFKEWEAELDDYESAELRRRSAAQLRETRREFDRLMQAMNFAASKMDPVLEIYEDHVLFLKHNLNARAIAALEGERVEIEARVEALIEEMENAIAEADAFIRAMS